MKERIFSLMKEKKMQMCYKNILVHEYIYVHTKIRIMIHHMHRTHTHLLEQNNIQTNRDLKDCYARINTIIRYLII